MQTVAIRSRFSVILPQHLRTAMSREARQHGVSRGTIIRWALSQFLDVPLEATSQAGTPGAIQQEREAAR